jgi:pre-mRNA-splicing helicase BRR2
MLFFLQNSTLVLTSENRTRDAHEPTGEPESLWGKMRGRMGDKVQYGRPDAAAEAEKKKKKDAAAAKKKRQQVGIIWQHGPG